MKKFLDTDHPMFRPLWVRVLIVAVCLAWALVEYRTGSELWAMLFLGLGVYAAYNFFIGFQPKDPDKP